MIRVISSPSISTIGFLILILPTGSSCSLAFGRGRDATLRLSRSEEHTSELQSPCNLVCRLLLEKKKKQTQELHPVHKQQHLHQHLHMYINTITQEIEFYTPVLRTITIRKILTILLAMISFLFS